MSHADKRQRWADYVAALGRRLAAAQKIQEILDEYPEMADDLIRSFHSQPEPSPIVAPPATPERVTSASTQTAGEELAPNPPQAPPRNGEAVQTSLFQAPDGRTLRQKIHDLLVSRQNKPISGPKIAEELGTMRGTVSNLLYSAGKEFEGIPDPGRRGRHTLWRLRHWPAAGAVNGASGKSPGQEGERHGPDSAGASKT